VLLRDKKDEEMLNSCKPILKKAVLCSLPESGLLQLLDLLRDCQSENWGGA